MTRPTRAQLDELIFCLVALGIAPGNAAQQALALGGPVPRDGWNAAGRAACIRHLDRLARKATLAPLKKLATAQVHNRRQRA